MTSKRERYESEEDLARERKVAAYLGTMWRCNLYKLNPYSYGVDFAATRVGEGIVAWVELKGAPNAYFYEPREAIKGKLVAPEYAQLAIQKWRAGQELAAATGIPFLVAFDYYDAVVYHAFDPEAEYVYEIGGRSNPRDAEDVEPMVRIPREACKLIGGTGGDE